MEQPRTPSSQRRPNRTTPLPPQGGPHRDVSVRGSAAAPDSPYVTSGAARPTGNRRPAGRSARPPRSAPPGGTPAASLGRMLRRLPDPRLTGLGSALFCTAAMLTVAALSALCFGATQTGQTVYGVFFLPVSLLTALWLRKADLVLGPIIVPIAFAVGVLPVIDGGDGLADSLMGLFTALALQAGWLYGGTLVAGVTVTVRKVRLMARRAAARSARAGKPPQPRSPRTAAERRTGPRTAGASRRD